MIIRCAWCKRVTGNKPPYGGKHDKEITDGICPECLEKHLMKETPIIFSANMVRAILNGTKTMTRRIIKPQPSSNSKIFVRALTNRLWWQEFDGYYEDAPPRMFKCPYGQVGDRLWVRESYCINALTEKPMYKADFIGTEWVLPAGGWRPSIFMPRWASRITLEITEVRVERLQEISREDVLAEGVSWQDYKQSYDWAFKKLWDSLNAKRGYGWDANPWVWVIGFKVI